MPLSEYGPHFALVGPTASGKSAIAMEVARRLGDIEIVAVDSMQVYRGMDIGTAKPPIADRDEIPHHLLDLADPSERFTVTRFQDAFATAMASIEDRGRRALLVGGTGLYLNAVVDRFEVPGDFPAEAAALETEPDTETLHRRLTEIDPVAATKMTPTNRRRIVRALSVCLGSGRQFSSFGPGIEGRGSSRFRMAGVWLPRQVVRERIRSRVEGMIHGGLLDEVRGLATAPGGMAATARQALGYKELVAHIEDGLSLEDAAAQIVTRTVAFSRRQRMWFRRDPRITWHAAPSNPLAVVPAVLGDWTR